MIDRLYNYLVNRKPNIYQKYRTHRKGRRGLGIIGSWFYLLRLNIMDAISKGQESDEQAEGRSIRFKEQPEGLEARRETVEQLFWQCEEFDVISFDVFDTLLFRGVNEPSDAFYYIEEKLGYPNLGVLRREMEGRAYRLKKQNASSNEVTLEYIWQLIEKEMGIESSHGIEIELEIEKEVCFANPYMVELLKKLKEKKKRIIAISDMYLSEGQIRTLLTESGIPDVFEEFFVSSEHGASKHDGRLFDIVKRKMGQELSYFHIGDNEHADVKQGKKHGFNVYHYLNVNDVGAPYREVSLSIPEGSAYNGLVNAYIHNGLEQYSKEYELGFIYGGPLALYCRKHGVNDDFQSNQMVKLLLESEKGEYVQGVEDFSLYYMEKMKGRENIREKDILRIIKGLEKYKDKVIRMMS